MVSGDVKNIGWRLMPWFANLLCAFLCWWATGVNTELKRIGTDLTMLREWRAETSANRWTASDHTRYADEQNRAIQSVLAKISDMQQVWLRDIAEIKIQLASVPKKDDLPPQWFREYVKNIETRLDDHMKEQKKP